MMKENIIKYLQYNLWANEQLANYLQNLNDSEIEQPIVSSFPSIRQTVLHINDAEILWKLRLEGGTLSEFPSKNFKGTKHDLLKQWLETSTIFLAHIGNQEEAYFEQEHTYMTMSYGETTQTAYDMLHHCMNHSTYHRGQVTTMLRQLGYTDPPHLDFMLYLIQRNATK
jgi:uncharacterized damage-inducible protein DinB